MNRWCGLSCVGDVLIVLSRCEEKSHDPMVWTVMRW